MDVNAFGNAHPEDNAEGDLLALFPMMETNYRSKRDTPPFVHIYCTFIYIYTYKTIVSS